MRVMPRDRSPLLRLLAVVLAVGVVAGAVMFARADDDPSKWDGPNNYTSWEHDEEEGYGTLSKPFLIESAANLEYLAHKVNSGTDYSGKYFSLTIDIDLQGNNADHMWVPIGNNKGQNHVFTGVFNGNGHIIKNLNVNSGTGRGLFGFSSGTITGVAVTGSIETNIQMPSGGIVGVNLEGGMVKQCYNECTFKMNGASAIVGGIAGRNLGTISYCYNIGAIASDGNSSYAGGISGANGDTNEGTNILGTVKFSYNYGNITCKNKSGGIVGQNTFTGNDEEGNDVVESGKIIKCYYLNSTSQYLDGESSSLESSLNTSQFSSEQSFDNTTWKFYNPGDENSNDNVWLISQGRPMLANIGEGRNIICIKDGTHGTVVADTYFAEPKEKVTLTVTRGDNYYLSDLSIVGTSEAEKVNGEVKQIEREQVTKNKEQET